MVMKLIELCTKQGTVLDKAMARIEQNPGILDTPEMQAEMRRELEYAAYLMSTVSKEIFDRLGVEA